MIVDRVKCESECEGEWDSITMFVVLPVDHVVDPCLGIGVPPRV